MNLIALRSSFPVIRKNLKPNRRFHVSSHFDEHAQVILRHLTMPIVSKIILGRKSAKTFCDRTVSGGCIKKNKHDY